MQATFIIFLTQVFARFCSTLKQEMWGKVIDTEGG